MADRVNVSVEATHTLRGLDGLARDLADPDLDPIAARGAEIATREAPRRTGRLAGGNRGRTSRGRAEVENAVPYAGPVNSGTDTTPANPFLTRTAEQLGPDAVDLLGDYIDTRIRKRGLA